MALYNFAAILILGEFLQRGSASKASPMTCGRPRLGGRNCSAHARIWVPVGTLTSVFPLRLSGASVRHALGTRVEPVMPTRADRTRRRRRHLPTWRQSHLERCRWDAP